MYGTTMLSKEMKALYKNITSDKIQVRIEEPDAYYQASSSKTLQEAGGSTKVFVFKRLLFHLVPWLKHMKSESQNSGVPEELKDGAHHLQMLWTRQFCSKENGNHTMRMYTKVFPV
ncbi:hypothetical protein Adt_39343 [Abeliophyllum distichum]|uniref:Uncharacterized protein n=1 Tax=Abeliophyllum distichum TaxID=126358 RepID=A0ABD1Q4U1_9LAMI